MLNYKVSYRTEKSHHLDLDFSFYYLETEREAIDKVNELNNAGFVATWELLI